MNEIIVGNVGTVYRGTDNQIAKKEFDIYVNCSQSNFGRVASEPVTWLKDNEIYMEYEV